LSYPKARDIIKISLGEMIKEKFQGVEGIAGVATAGIPQGALVADLFNLPFIYVRSKPKGHGLENLIEGNVVPGQKVVVIEDLISTGGSSIQAIQALRKAEIKVLGLLSVFTYQFPQADENFKAENIISFSLSNYTSLVEVALEKNLIKSSDVKMLKEWRESPETWGK
jgi:orotate phosphoribosyltransferase